MLTKPLERKTITNKSQSNTKKYQMAAEAWCNVYYNSSAIILRN